MNCNYGQRLLGRVYKEGEVMPVTVLESFLLSRSGDKGHLWPLRLRHGPPATPSTGPGSPSP